MLKTSSTPVVQSLPLFTGLSEQEKDLLIKGGKIRSYDAGEAIFHYGDPVTHFLVLCEGAVQLFRETPDGHEMTSEVLMAGDTIGETEILQDHQAHRFNALAIKKTTVMEFPLQWLKENARKYSAIALNLLAVLSRRTHIASVEAEHKATMSAAQQVACFMERLCILHDFDPKGFELPYSKTLIASRLGMELETFSRALSKMRDHGISVKGIKVSFDDIRKMEDFACGDCSIAGNCQEHEALKQRLNKAGTEKA